MTSLRPFARPVLLLWLLAFALAFTAPQAAFAKVSRTDGDGSEGDPDDGVDALGGGGGANDFSETSGVQYTGVPKIVPALLDGLILYVPGKVLPVYVLFVRPMNAAFDGGEE